MKTRVQAHRRGRQTQERKGQKVTHAFHILHGEVLDPERCCKLTVPPSVRSDVALQFSGSSGLDHESFLAEEPGVKSAPFSRMTPFSEG